MISIIIPAYNIENYITRCLDSLIHQTYTMLEIIVIDDGSTDSTPKILDEYALKDQRIKVVHSKNQGVSAARNLGLSKANGEYLFFIDGDDFIREDFLEKLMESMNSEIDIVGGGNTNIYEDEHTSINQLDKVGLIRGKECIEDYYHNLFYTRVIWGKIFRKELWDDVLFYPIKYSEDTRAMFDVLQNCRNYLLIKDYGYYYLQRNNSAIHTLKEQIPLDTKTTLQYSIDTAKEKYPEYLYLASQNYINYMYVLLKIYILNHDKEKAYSLIKEMKEARKNLTYSQMNRSQKLLGFPCFMVYRLLKLKRGN